MRRLDERRSGRGGASWALALLLALGVAACNSGPSAPVEEMFFSGSVGPLGVEEFRFPVGDASLLRVTLQELTWLDADGEPVVAGGSPTLGVTLGRVEDDVCDTSATFVIQQGGFVVYGLTSGDFCLQVFEPQFLIEGEELVYTLFLEPTD